MTRESETSPDSPVRKPRPAQGKAPWKTPRLVEHGTITVRTLGSGAVPAPAPPP